jgi:hypothetical protein
MSSSAIVIACSICFGAADGPMLDAARLGVLVMVGVTCAVLVLFGRFFLRTARRGEGSLLPSGVPERGEMPRAGFVSRSTGTGH